MDGGCGSQIGSRLDARKFSISALSGPKKERFRATLLIEPVQHRRVAIGDSNHKGNLAELAIAKAAAELGVGVYKPLTEHGRSDLIFEVEDALLRVQCKWANKKGDVISIRTSGSYHSPTRGYVVSTYTRGEIDAVAAYCQATETCFLLPIAEIEGLSIVHLRLRPARNGQFAGVRMASEYELARGCSSAGRASGWQPLGRGFESPQLHPPAAAGQTVRAHEFRDRFGSYMERASRGETFYVTRRGRPHVVLGPSQPRLLDEKGREPSGPDLEEP
jgi:prevent-host-death family protein